MLVKNSFDICIYKFFLYLWIIKGEWFLNKLVFSNKYDFMIFISCK